MAGEDKATPPSVLWCQRASTILLTICIEDCVDPEIKINPDSVSFSGVGGPDKQPHKVTINMYKEIDPEKSLKFLGARVIELVLKKKEDGPFWPQLTKEKVKYHWLKVDFNKWKDEDDSEDEGGMGPMGMMGGPPGHRGDMDLEEMMQSMGNFGQPMDDPSAGTKNESDSDDEDLPDLV